MSSSGRSRSPGEAVDVIDVGLLHHLEELPRVRGERLDVTALPLGVDRVERERGLAGAREAGDADQTVPRQADGDVLEVVLAGAVDNEFFGRHMTAILPSEHVFVQPLRHTADLELAGDDGAVAEDAAEEGALDFDRVSGVDLHANRPAFQDAVDDGELVSAENEVRAIPPRHCHDDEERREAEQRGTGNGERAPRREEARRAGRREEQRADERTKKDDPVSMRLDHGASFALAR